MVDVVVAVRQQTLAPDVGDRVAPKIFCQRRQLRIVDLLYAQLGLKRVEHTDDPAETRIRVCRLESNFLREILLRIGDVVDRFVVAKSGQIDAIGGQKRGADKVGINRDLGSNRSTQTADAWGDKIGIEAEVDGLLEIRQIIECCTVILHQF